MRIAFAGATIRAFSLAIRCQHVPNGTRVPSGQGCLSDCWSAYGWRPHHLSIVPSGATILIATKVPPCVCALIDPFLPYSPGEEYEANLGKYCDAKHAFRFSRVPLGKKPLLLRVARPHKSS